MVPGDSIETVTDASSQQEGGRRRASCLSDRIQQLDELDAQQRYEEETKDRGIDALHQIRSKTQSRTNQVVIAWEVNDPENPYNWPNASIYAPLPLNPNSRKSFISFLTSMLVINSTMGSALPSMAVPSIAREFGVTSTEQKVLPISVFLIGYVLGPVIWGPLSEHLGRRHLTIATFAAFSLFTMACALAPSWPALLVCRMFCGVFASAPIAIVAGIIADVYGEPRTRGRAFAVFIVTTIFGPLLSPIVSGFTSSTIGWRWSFWIGLMYAGATLVMIVLLPETFGPILLARRARKMCKHDASLHAVAPRDLEGTDLNQLLTIVLTRPLRMLASELIVSATCAYLALVYSIFYMSFQAFPIIFQQLYSLSPGVTGLCYLPIGAGACLSMLVFWYWDGVLARAQERGAPWIKREEYRRVPLACCGGPLFAISLFWLGLTARSSVSFVVPMIAGVPFGMGFMLIFMALLNYLTDAYEIFAASANAAASCCRSLLAVVLPLATSHMFATLGISGACALLGGLSAGMCVIPFIFIWKGPSIRSRSRFCIALKERKEEMQMKAEEDRQRLERAAEREKEQDMACTLAAHERLKC
ncbi:Polyamine transporter 3 [Tolypocladium ophioglossoides CBS 100239]|uniref:Polyamine transporter 3 n=1 Tax=Tolypocladium ophioglossoides (strain CBS 100239) TaxID=1163406 RepID=A0A0L0NIT9_TOLOC|nr:Polyamine transporter 3 [Tolypocladium ophioglossoides CBS 100239]